MEQHSVFYQKPHQWIIDHYGITNVHHRTLLRKGIAQTPDEAIAMWNAERKQQRERDKQKLVQCQQDLAAAETRIKQLEQQLGYEPTPKKAILRDDCDVNEIRGLDDIAWEVQTNYPGAQVELKEIRCLNTTQYVASVYFPPKRARNPNPRPVQAAAREPVQHEAQNARPVQADPRPGYDLQTLLALI